MSETVPQPTSVPLDRDVACVRCGYNLRGSDPDGRCPECGAAVMDSLGRDTLSFADPQWLRQLAKGCSYLRVAFTLLIVDGAVCLVAGTCLVGMVFEKVRELAIAILAMLVLACTITVLCLSIGSVLISSPDPSATLNGRRADTRHAVRGVAAATLGLNLILVVVGWCAWQGTPGSMPRWLLETALIGLPSGVTLLIILAITTARKLLLRTDLPRQISNTSWIALVALAIWFKGLHLIETQGTPGALWQISIIGSLLLVALGISALGPVGQLHERVGGALPDGDTRDAEGEG